MRTKFWALCVCGVVASLTFAIVTLTSRLRSLSPRDPRIIVIESLGGNVSYNRDGSAGGVAFRNQRVTESHVRALAGLRQLPRLDLSYSHLADADLSFLGRLSAIESLDVGDTNITPGALKNVVQCPTIKYVYALRTRTDDSSVAAVASLPELHALYLAGTAISDSGLMALRQARGLELLSIADTHVTDSGVSSLVKCLPQLQGLVLRNCPVGSQTMREIGKLTELISLNLEGTQVTDGDMKWLRGLRKLEGLNVSNTKISRRAIAELESTLPNLEPVRSDANKVEHDSKPTKAPAAKSN